MRKGYIVAVCTSSKDGVPKYPQDMGVVAQYGLLGDFHCKAMRRSFSKPGTEKPNDDRHITVVALEAIQFVNNLLELNLGPGALGENILTVGLGNLSDIRDGAIICIGNIRLRVVKQNQPCKNLVHYHPNFNQKIRGQRGLLCAVVAGIEMVMRPGQVIEVDG